MRIALKVLAANKLVGGVLRHKAESILPIIHYFFFNTLHVTSIDVVVFDVIAHDCLTPRHHSIFWRMSSMVIMDEVELLDEGEVNRHPDIHFAILFETGLDFKANDDRLGISCIHIDAVLLEVHLGFNPQTDRGGGNFSFRRDSPIPLFRVFYVCIVHKMEDIAELRERHQKLVLLQKGHLFWHTCLPAVAPIPTLINKREDLHKHMGILLVVASHNKRCAVGSKTEKPDIFIVFSLRYHLFVTLRNPCKSFN